MDHPPCHGPAPTDEPFREGQRWREDGRVARVMSRSGVPSGPYGETWPKQVPCGPREVSVPGGTPNHMENAETNVRRTLLAVKSGVMSQIPIYAPGASL